MQLILKIISSLFLHVTFSSCSYKYVSEYSNNRELVFYKYNDQASATNNIGNQYTNEQQCIIKCHMTNCLAMDIEEDGGKVKCNFFKEPQTLVTSTGKWHISRKQLGFCQLYDDICGICDCHNAIDSARPYYCDCRPYQNGVYQTTCQDTLVLPFTKSAFYAIEPFGEETMDVFCQYSIHEATQTVMIRFHNGETLLDKMSTGFGWENNYWIGLDKLHILTNDVKYTSVVDIWDENFVHHVSEYTNFKVAHVSTGYYLTYDHYIIKSGGAGMTFTKNRGIQICADNLSYWWGACANSRNFFYIHFPLHFNNHKNIVRLYLQIEPDLLSHSKAAYATTVHFDNVASRAFDGNLNQVLGGQGCYHSDDETKPELKVDLGSIYAIFKVTVYTRTDCCPERLHDAVIDVSNDLDFNETKICVSFHLITEPSQIETFNCVKGIKGQFVRIYMDNMEGNDEILQICEMQVYGR